MRYIVLAALYVLGALAANAERRAFIVGVSDYEILSDLPKTANDADGYRNLFSEQLGFDVTYLFDPNLSEFDAAFGRFLDTVSSGDEIVFVFSGHGWSDGSENFLIPADAPLRATDFELKLKTRRLNAQILAELRARSPKNIVAIIDACRDDPFDNFSKSGGRGGLTRLPTFEGTLVLYAAGQGQKALERLSEDDPSPYSLFTRVLLPLLSDKDRPLQDIVRETKADVRSLALTVPHYQVPSYADELIGDYCWSGQCRTTAAMEGSKTGFLELVSDWEVAAGENTSSAWGVFLEKHPVSDFSATAKDLQSIAIKAETAISGAQPSPKRPADIEKWQEVGALLVEREDGSYFNVCGAVFIAPNWALTTANCVTAYPNLTARIAQFSSTTSTSDPLSFDTSVLQVSGLLVEVEQAIVHPAYERGEYVGEYDIALLKTKARWPGTQTILPRSTSNTPLPSQNEALVTSGYGTLTEDIQFQNVDFTFSSDGGLRSNKLTTGGSVLMETTILFDSREACIDEFYEPFNASERHIETTKAQHLCARSSAIGAGSCLGDEGTGVWAMNVDGTRRLVGLVHAGIGCFRERGSELIIDLSEFTNWIVDVVGAETLYGPRRNSGR